MAIKDQDSASFLRNGFNRAEQTRGSVGSFKLLILLMVIFSAAWTASYTVPNESAPVVQRFGKHLEEVSSELHLMLPLWIDKATIVPVERPMKQESEFARPVATDPSQSFRVHNGLQETKIASGDLNAALVEWIVHYRISEPFKFLFQV